MFSKGSLIWTVSASGCGAIVLQPAVSNPRTNAPSNFLIALSCAPEGHASPQNDAPIKLIIPRWGYERGGAAPVHQVGK